MERSAGASMQSLPPRPMALPPSLNTIQHSLSLNGSTNTRTHTHVINGMCVYLLMRFLFRFIFCFLLCLFLALTHQHIYVIVLLFNN